MNEDLVGFDFIGCFSSMHRDKNINIGLRMLVEKNKRPWKLAFRSLLLSNLMLCRAERFCKFNLCADHSVSFLIFNKCLLMSPVTPDVKLNRCLLERWSTLDSSTEMIERSRRRPSEVNKACCDHWPAKFTLLSHLPLCYSWPVRSWMWYSELREQRRRTASDDKHPLT